MLVTGGASVNEDDPPGRIEDPIPGHIRQGPLRAQLQVLAFRSGLTAPLYGTFAPGPGPKPGETTTQPHILYVVDQDGPLWAVDVRTGAKRLFINTRTQKPSFIPLGAFGPGTFDERGFLGVAFHPDYGSNGKLYTYTSEPVVGLPTFPSTVPPGVAPDHQNVLAEWMARGGVVDPASRRELMRVDWPQFNHDGGDLAFGPDRMLYVSMGDGGSADDADGQLFTTAPPNYPPCGEAPTVGHQGDGNAQKLNTPHGKVLRIDVDGRTSANGQYGIP